MSVFGVCYELLQCQSPEWTDLIHSLLIIEIAIDVWDPLAYTLIYLRFYLQKFRKCTHSLTIMAL